MSKYNSKSVYGRSGKLLKFSFEHFITDVVKGKACFMCGALPGTKVFNDEHVIPDWLLRKFDSHSKKVKLPNSAPVLYGAFKIPCCQECNTLLGKRIEEPVAKIFNSSASYDTMLNHVKDEGFNLLFVWLSLIFLKHHLYDSKVRYHLDRRRRSDITIGDRYPWPLAEHALCVARSPYTNTVLTNGTIGSCFIYPVRQSKRLQFDHMDFFYSQAIMMQIYDVFMICVIDDAGYCNTVLKEEHERMKPPLFNIQCREIFAKYAYTSQRIKLRPKLHSDFLVTGQPLRTAEVPDAFELSDWIGEDYGKLLCEATKDKHIPGDPTQDLSLGQQISEFVEARKRRGDWSYVFDDNGAFNEQGIFNLTTLDAHFKIT